MSHQLKMLLLLLLLVPEEWTEWLMGTGMKQKN